MSCAATQCHIILFEQIASIGKKREASGLTSSRPANCWTEENMRCTPGYFWVKTFIQMSFAKAYFLQWHSISQEMAPRSLIFGSYVNILENAPLFAFDYCRGLYIPEGKAIGALLRKYPPSYILPLLDISTTPYCIGTFWELFTKSQISISERAVWVAGRDTRPRGAIWGTKQPLDVLDVRIFATRKIKLQGFHQPKLAHLIEPLQQKRKSAHH